VQSQKAARHIVQLQSSVGVERRVVPLRFWRCNMWELRLVECYFRERADRAQQEVAQLTSVTEKLTAEVKRLRAGGSSSAAAAGGRPPRPKRRLFGCGAKPT
jgi:hypothetical protein